MHKSITKFQTKIKNNIPDIDTFENFRSGSNLSLFILFWIGLISGFIIFNSIRYFYFEGNALSIDEPVLYLIVLSIMLIVSRTKYYRINIYFLIVFSAIYLNLQFYLPRDQASYFFLYVGLNVVIQMTASLFLTLKKSFYIPLVINIGSTAHLLLLGYSDYGTLGLFQTFLFLDLVFFVLNYYYQKRYEQVHSYVNLLVQEKLISEQALDAKNKFLAKMSHELRTPLNIASGALQTATLEASNQTDSNVEQHFMLEENHFNMIKKANYDLTNLINNLIIYSEMNENLLINMEFLNLNKIVRDRINYYRHYIDANIDFSYQLHQFDDHLLIKNDKTLLQYIIDNLISNAIKNTHKGFIQVRINAIKQNDSKTKVSFEIKDSGVGISPSDRDKIFNGFSSDQNNDSLDKDPRGVGLGLNITKNIIDLLGGTITFESELQKGTTFFVSFQSDYRIGEEKEEEKLDTCHQKILIAEDNLENLELLKFLLKRHNFRFQAFENGKQALDHFTNNKNYLQYDIILMDLRMPIMDGFEATRKIREFEKEHNLKKIPIIAVTAHALKEELLKSLDVGCNSYITKPYEFKDLEILINRYTNKKE